MQQWSNLRCRTNLEVVNPRLGRSKQVRGQNDPLQENKVAVGLAIGPFKVNPTL